MTPQLEKVFFNYILKNKKYFHVVKTYFFRNSEIQFVYDVIQKYILTSSESEIPSNRQILDMVTLEDKEGNITKDILRSILQVNLAEYSEVDFILPKFNSWILSNRLKAGAVDVIEETRNLESSANFDKTVETANRIRSIIDEMSSTSFIQDDDMGSDFDDVENHIQDSSKYKVKCGYETIDHMLGGGWDIQTLNVIMAQTNGGKCFFPAGNIKIRTIDTQEVSNIQIGELFDNFAYGHI